MSLTKGGFGNHPAFAESVPPPVAPPAQQGFSLPVFWPGNQILHVKYDSADYYFDPGVESQVYGTFQHQRDQQKGHILFDRPLTRKLGPDEVLEGLLSLYSDRGLRALTGNAITNERIKIEARAAYIPWRIAECETIIANHEADCSMAVAGKHRPPRPGRAWREAKADLEALELASADGKRFVCGKDGMDFDTEEAAFAWVRSQYRGTDPKTVIIDTRSNDPKPAVADDGPKAAPVQAAQVQTEDDPRLGQSDPLESQKRAIFLAAGQAGTALTQEILDALKSDDRETVELGIAAANDLLNGPQ